MKAGVLLLVSLMASFCSAFRTQSTRLLSTYTRTTPGCRVKSVERLQAPSRLFSLSAKDEECLRQAIECAKNGLGVTFPNPAVGCVLVDQSTGDVLGKGFHPRAGYPHAEVFALFEAAGLVPDGIQAAKEIVQKPEDDMEDGVVENLLMKYACADGGDKLFGDLFADKSVTAYVTLEPCSHFGLTPPCAYSLATAKVNRVVVGFRDPNPRVDGGGVQFLREVNVTVDMAADDKPDIEKACSELVTNFVKRITPSEARDDYSYITGAMRRALRAMANRQRRSGTITEVVWQGDSVKAGDNMKQGLEELILPARWMEELDATLWKEELVSLKLNAAVQKKKGAKILGERIADALKAHVAQILGHTCLLYRPAAPPFIDLEALVADDKGGNDDAE